MYVFFLIIHSVIACQITKSLDIERVLGSILILIIMLAAIYYFTLFLHISSEKIFNNTLIVILCTLLVISFSGVILAYVPFTQYKALNSPIFPFVEPSHYSLIIAPFYLWVTIKQKKTIYKLLLIMGGLILLIYVSNLTLVVVILLNCFLVFDFKKIIFIIFISIIFASTLTFDATYYTKRVDIEDNNLSTLVWLQGWEEAYLDIQKTSGFGIGFQQFGVAEPEGDSASAIFSLIEEHLNRYDGGTFASKLIGELGVFGVILLIIMLNETYKSIIFLKKLDLKIEKHNHLIFYHCCICYFIVELFVRSMSYIAPGFFMFMLGIVGTNITNLQSKQL